jgi:DNA-directed RNA polymerase subunit RPC12/RpoP
MIQTDEYWCVTEGRIIWADTKRRKYVRCPKCNRRLLVTEITSFGELIGYGIPPHKIRKTKRKKRKK